MPSNPTAGPSGPQGICVARRKIASLIHGCLGHTVQAIQASRDFPEAGVVAI